MTAELDHAREIAERIARRVSSGNSSRSEPPKQNPALTTELAAVRASLSDLQRKIAQLEARVVSEPHETHRQTSDAQLYSSGAGIDVFDQRARPVPLTHSPWLAGVNAPLMHPSQEKFGVEEAVVAELVDHFEKEKTCNVEPGGKPCDHCAMCSSRGF